MNQLLTFFTLIFFATTAIGAESRFQDLVDILRTHKHEVKSAKLDEFVSRVTETDLLEMQRDISEYIVMNFYNRSARIDELREISFVNAKIILKLQVIDVIKNIFAEKSNRLIELYHEYLQDGELDECESGLLILYIIELQYILEELFDRCYKEQKHEMIFQVAQITMFIPSPHIRSISFRYLMYIVCLGDYKVVIKDEFIDTLNYVLPSEVQQMDTDIRKNGLVKSKFHAKSNAAKISEILHCLENSCK